MWTHEDGQELVVLGNGRLCGYDAATGVEKWFVNGFSRETISRPIAGEARRKERLDGMFARTDKDNHGFWTKEEFLNSISFDRGKPNLVAVRPGGQGDVTESHVTWVLHRNIPEVPSPVLHRNRIYLVRDGGIPSAVDADNGKIIYRKRLRATGHYRSSPVIANDKVYVISQEGVVSMRSLCRLGGKMTWSILPVAV